MRRALFLAALALALLPVAATATPVAKTEAEREQLGRVFPEPMRSTDFINHGPRNGPSEIATGMGRRRSRYPNIVA